MFPNIIVYFLIDFIVECILNADAISSIIINVMQYLLEVEDVSPEVNNIHTTNESAINSGLQKYLQKQHNYYIFVS
jgi:hypothetical protein